MITIVEAKISDAKQLLRLQKGCYIQEAEIYGDYTIPPLIQDLASMKSELENQTILKALEYGTIIGSIRAYKDSGICKIGRLMVHPKHQNQGLGKLLMEDIEKRFKTSLKFQIFTGHKSEKNLAFYKKLGYKESYRKEIHPNLQLVFLEKVNT